MNFRDVAMELVKRFNCRDIAELGVWRGELSRMFAMVARRLILVDPMSAEWNDLPEYQCTIGEPIKTQKELDEMYEAVRRDVPWADYLRMTSLEAAPLVPDYSLDMVFIDSVHTCEYASREIAAWMPKLRHLYGVMAGDDYCGPVRDAVDRSFGKRVNCVGNVWWVQI